MISGNMSYRIQNKILKKREKNVFFDKKFTISSCLQCTSLECCELFSKQTKILQSLKIP
jgi:hypothetical protein